MRPGGPACGLGRHIFPPIDPRPFPPFWANILDYNPAPPSLGFLNLIMPLPALPSDPEPSAQELKPYLERAANVSGHIRYAFARIQWRGDLRKREDSAFLVAFATEVDDYLAYLKSDVWKAIRKRVLTAADRKCAGCGGKATQVHHRDYRPSVLRGDNDLPLVALCKTCHDAVHAGDKNKSWQACERDLHRLVAAEDARTTKAAKS